MHGNYLTIRTLHRFDLRIQNRFVIRFDVVRIHLLAIGLMWWVVVFYN